MWIYRSVAAVGATLVLLAVGCNDQFPAWDAGADDGEAATRGAVQEAAQESQERPSAFGREEDPPEELGVRAAFSLLGLPYVNGFKHGGLCGEETTRSYADENAPIAHGLTADSDLPAELIDLLEAGGEFSLIDYEFRWFEEDRIVLFTRTPHGPDDRNVAAVAEVVLYDGNPPAWGVRVDGDRYICDR